MSQFDLALDLSRSVFTSDVAISFLEGSLDSFITSVFSDPDSGLSSFLSESFDVLAIPLLAGLFLYRLLARLWFLILRVVCFFVITNLLFSTLFGAFRPSPSTNSQPIAAEEFQLSPDELGELVLGGMVSVILLEEALEEQERRKARADQRVHTSPARETRKLN